MRLNAGGLVTLGLVTGLRWQSHAGRSWKLPRLLRLLRDPIRQNRCGAHFASGYALRLLNIALDVAQSPASLYKHASEAAVRLTAREVRMSGGYLPTI